MGLSPPKYVMDVHLILKIKIHTGLLAPHCSFSQFTAASSSSTQLLVFWQLPSFRQLFRIHSSTTGNLKLFFISKIAFVYIKNINFTLIWLVIISGRCFFIRVSCPVLNPSPKSVHFLDYLNFRALFDFFLWSIVNTCASWNIALCFIALCYMLIIIELTEFV